MRNVMATVLALIGVAAVPAAAMVSGFAEFPRQGAAGYGLILIQSTDGCQKDCVAPPPPPPDRSDPSVPAPPPGVAADAIGITPAATLAIVNALKDAASFCRSLIDPRLNVDCVSDQYRYIATALPFKGGYAGVRNALFTAAIQLHQLAVDHNGGVASVRPSKGGRSPHHALTPVTQNPGAVARKAVAIIEGTTLVLLRSSSGSEQRRIAYEQVAAVVDSTKVLLRSV